MDTTSPGAGLRVAGFIVGGVGLVLAAAGFTVARFMPGLVAAEQASLEALPTPDAIVLGDTPAGREVLIEGRIAASQPVRFRDFVAYAREEKEFDSMRKEDVWRVKARESPPLTLAIEGGTARIVNDTYGLSQATTVWYDRSRIRDTRYVGFTANEAVVVLGQTTAGGLQAAAIVSGTRASYLATVASGSAVAWWLGTGFMALGGLLVALAATLLFMAVRKARPAAR